MAMRAALPGYQPFTKGLGADRSRQLLIGIACGIGDGHADHRPHAGDPAEARQMRSLRPDRCTHAFSGSQRPRRVVMADEFFQNSQRCCCRHGMHLERRGLYARLPTLQYVPAACENGAGNAATCRFAEHQQIRNDACPRDFVAPLKTKQAPGAAIAGEHLIHDQQCSRLLRGLANSVEPSRRRNTHAGRRLHRFGDHRCNISPRQFLTKARRQMAGVLSCQRIGQMSGVRDKGPQHGITAPRMRKRERTQGSAMIGPFEGDEAAAPGCVDRCLERGLHRLRAIGHGVKHAEFGRQYGGQPLHQPDLHRRMEMRPQMGDTGVELFPDGAHHGGVAMAKHRRARTAGEIEVMPALRIGQPGSSPRHEERRRSAKREGFRAG